MTFRFEDTFSWTTPFKVKRLILKVESTSGSHREKVKPSNEANMH